MKNILRSKKWKPEEVKKLEALFGKEGKSKS